MFPGGGSGSTAFRAQNPGAVFCLCAFGCVRRGSSGGREASKVKLVTSSDAFFFFPFMDLKDKDWHQLSLLDECI